MVGNGETALFGNFMLTPLDFLVEKFLDPATIEANQMIVVRSYVEFEYRFAGFEMVAVQQPGLLELGQYAIYCCQPDIHVFYEQHFIHVFRTQMANFAVLENFEYLEAWQRRFQAAGL